MTSSSPDPTVLRTANLRNSQPTRFKLEPDAPARDALAKALDAVSVRKLRFEGEVAPKGRSGWELTAQLGATVVQSCIVTLEPVTTRIDTPVTRRFVPAEQMSSYEAGSEIEMPEDDETEELGEVIDLAAVMTEALSLALPDFPRKDGAVVETAQFAEDGVTPMTDEDTKPFAGLAALREKMQGKDGEE
mgnify:CR=1 FL=1